MDCEREKFRVYVEKSGVMSLLTDVLVGLYELPQKPEDALGYIKNVLSQNQADMQKIAILEERIKELETENKSLKEELKQQQRQEPAQQTEDSSV